jgi:large subunit ribosomal protein L16
VLFEIAGVSEEVAKEAMERAAFKLPIRTQFVKRETLGEG